MGLWIFQTGHAKGLARAELETVFKADGIQFIDEVEDGFLVELNLKDPIKTLQGLGGTVRITELVYQAKRSIPLNFSSWVVDAIKKDKKDMEGKLRYGLSMHPKSDVVLKKVLSQSKELLKKNFQTPRFVNKNFQNLSSAQAWHEKLLEDNASELHLFQSEEFWYLSKTRAIQDLEWYHHRDMDRPAKSSKVGMFPPKLAQILINLSEAKDCIYDPFCGLGTVLQEATLKGLKAYGSDIHPDQVESTQKNLEWLYEEALKRGIVIPDHVKEDQIFLADAQSLNKSQLPNTAFAVVTETWLGPLIDYDPRLEEIAKIHEEILKLYDACLKNWSQIMPKGSIIVLTAPYHKIKNERYFILELPKLLSQYAQILPLSVHQRASLFFERKGQWVGREIWKIQLRGK